MGALKTILIVDDIVYNRLLINDIIESCGYETYNANNGSEAIQLLEQHKFDLVVMDLEMPIMNGFETTKYIRTELKNENATVIIIAITAHSYTIHSEPFASSGFNGLLKKPYTVERVEKLLAHHLENK